ncbi:MAG TPA: hypothetical protein O0X19_01135 [Methanocorpusculum sp.]|nr:hypothetical protein [Methanocorpusculum sp.]HJJ32974.1 hypothetical protein [Methanocorpusculum sp.]HJJ44183.1 hypothetical protein [Methanocorpusculum sp.]HJJ58378.1 hypothetical protein [Methanocorpusculum sp.]HJJ59927.1 hypothetical protein [Methanocorpusculum sp.]
MSLLEIQMNRLGINSIEISHKDIEVSVGTPLHVKITNYGAPTHVTLKTDGGAYTPFTYENIYLEAESEISIPILSNAGEGSFVLNVISGYGMRKAEVIVNVIKPQPEPEIPLEEAVFREEVRPQRAPSSHKTGKIIGCLVLPVIALVWLIVWFFLLGPLYPAFPGVAAAGIVFVLMLAGILITWLSAR